MTQPLHEASPQPGFYRYRRNKTARWEPCAIWLKDGELVCRISDRMEDAHAVWTWVADNKVSKEAAQFAFKAGHFPDEPTPVPLSNLPADPYEALKVTADEKQARAEEWLKAIDKVTTQEQANLARNMQAELLEINKEADALFTAEKAPHLKAGRAVDTKYRWRDAIGTTAAKLRKAYGGFMAAEERRQKAEAQARYNAELDRLAKERAAQKTNDPVAFHTSAEPELPLAPETVRVTAGGGVGRKAGLRDNWVPVFDDYAAAAVHVIHHPDVRAEVERVIRHMVKDAKGACAIPGVTIKNERVAA